MRPRPISHRMTGFFLVSIALMFLHKIECWWMHEWLDSPFFQWLHARGGILAESPEDAFGETVFLAFVTWLFIGLIMGVLTLWGGWGPHIALGIWGLTELLEWHHLIKTVQRGEYYVGLGTAMVFLAFMLLYWRELLKQVDWGPAPPVTGRSGTGS